TRLGPIVTLQQKAIELELGQKRFDQALARVQTLISQSRRKDKWWQQRGDILKLAGRPAEAKKAYRAALQEIEQLRLTRRQQPATVARREAIESSLAALTKKP
ncbi:MAG: tetratricopeptide repeat protein, partial [Verrucomicrobiota bacterium]